MADEAIPFCSMGRRADAIDWEPMLREILADLRKELPQALISVKFHNGLVEAVVQLAQRAATENVVLTGGCFQNKYLTERAIVRLRQAGFRPFWHRVVPTNDGRDCAGTMAAARLVRSLEFGVSR